MTMMNKSCEIIEMLLNIGLIMLYYYHKVQRGCEKMDKGKILKLVSNQSEKKKTSREVFDTKWLFPDLNVSDTFLNHFVRIDQFNGARRIMQCQYIIEHFPELFKDYQNLKVQMKMSDEVFKAVTEVYMYLGYDMLIVGNYAYSCRIFETLVFGMQDVTEDNYNFLIGYSVAIAGAGEIERFDAFADAYPEESLRPYFQLCKMYAMFNQLAYQQLNEEIAHIEKNFPTLLNVLLDKRYINLYLQQHTQQSFDVEEFDISEEHRDALVSLGMVMDFGLNIMIVVEYIQSRYDYLNPLKVSYSEALRKNDVNLLQSFMDYIEGNDIDDLEFADDDLYDDLDFKNLRILLANGLYTREDYLVWSEQEISELSGLSPNIIEYLKSKRIEFRKD